MNKKEKGNASYYLRIVLSLLLIASIMATLLAVFNLLTKDKIAENEKLETENTISEIFSEYSKTLESEEIETEIPEGSSVDSLYEVTANGVSIGYVVLCSPSGFKADIELAVGINPDGDCREVRVISLSETPGVGAKVAEESFLTAFKSQKGELKVNKDGGTIDAVAGATISSRAVTLGVSDALTLAESVIGGEAK